MRILGIVAVCASLTGSPTAADDNIFLDANQCSKAALRQYALSGSEPAEKVADVRQMLREMA